MNKVFTFLMSMMILLMVAMPSVDAQQAYRTLGNNPNVQTTHETKSVNPMKDSNKRSPQVTFFEEGFESGNFTTNDWELYDEDGDGNQWGVSNVYASHSGSYAAGSSSWSQGVALNPDNWMVTPLIDLTTASGTVLMDYWVRAQDQTWPNEYYGVFVSTEGSLPSDFTGTGGASLFEETVQKGTDGANNLYVKRTIDLSDYSGELVFLAFRHFNCTDWFVLDIDDIIVYESNTVDLGITGVAAPTNVDNCQLTDDEVVTVTLFNYGGAAQTGFDVSYTHNGNTVTETCTDTINPASSYDFSFSQHADFATLGYYDLSFSVSVTDDIDDSNNSFDYKVSSTDAQISVEVGTDSQGGQAWEIVATNGDVIASHGSYQWNITETTKVCVIADDCYTFNWYGGGSNNVSVYYNEVLINTTAATGNYTLYALGDACEPINVLFTGHNVENYGVVGDISFGGRFLNIGTDDITSFDVMYSVDGLASATETVSGLAIGQGETYEFTHGTSYNFQNTGEYAIVISISNLNGSFTPDENTLSHTTNILSYAPTTKILGEEGTGTWCGWCTRGHVFMEFMEETYPDTWIGVAVHNGDPMVVSSYDQGIANYIGGYPSGVVNRHDFGGSYDVDPSLFEAAYNILINKVVPANVFIENASYNEDTKVLNFDISTSFAGDLSKNFNINAVIIENDVTGTSTGYDQANYYSGGAAGLMGGYENLPDPVLARDMVYENVARAILGGWNGVSGKVDNPTVEDQMYTQNFSYTVPTGEDLENLHIIGIVLDGDSGEVVNSNKIDVITATTNAKEIKSLVDFRMYPNPVSQEINIELNFDQKQNVSIFVTDNMGRRVMDIEENQKMDSYSTKLNIAGFNAGVYFVNVKTEKGISVQKIVKL